MHSGPSPESILIACPPCCIEWERPSYARAEVPLPTVPPFTAYIGNLSYETTEGDLEDFFTPRPLTSTRIVTGHDGKPKGFAYVEFAELEDLKSALTLDGTSLVERRVRVSVAEPRRSSCSGQGWSISPLLTQSLAYVPFQTQAKERDDRTDREWRRDGPLPSLGDDRRGGGSRYSDRAPVDDSDWTMARGAKFQPTEDVPARSPNLRRDFSGGAPPFQRPAGSVGGFEAGNFERGSKFVASAPSPDQQSEGPRKTFGGPAAGPPGEADNASTWRRAAPVPSASPSAASPTSTSPPPAAPAQPAQRKKLELQPRSASAGSVAAAQPSPSSKPSPFGAAAPVDTAERERQVEARRAEARAEAEKQRAAAAEKKAVAAAAGPSASAPAAPASEGRAWRRAAPVPSPRSPDAQQNSAAAPAPAAAAPKSRQPSGSGPQGEKALRKEGFSFASAAAAKAAGEDVA